MRARFLLPSVALLFLVAASARAQVVYLQNDDWPGSGPLLCYTGITQDDSGIAAKFTAAPNQYPYTINSIRVLGCGGGDDIYFVRILQDNGGTAAPGPVIWQGQSGYELLGNNVFNEITFETEPMPPPQITSGSIRVELDLFDVFQPIGFGADVSGIQSHVNYVKSAAQVWSFAEDPPYNVAGDFVLRLGIVEPSSTPSLSVLDVFVPEGNSGTSQATFTVTLAAGGASTVTVDYATADGTATAGADYESTSGTLTFPPGASIGTVAVTIDADVLDEPDETFTLNLSNAQNATIQDGVGVGTILDDDQPPALFIGNVSQPEGDSGTTNADFPVTLSAPSGQAVSVDFGTADGTATAPSDYLTTGGTLSFAAGQTAASIPVAVVGDLIDEPDETFFVNLSNAQNATIGDGQALGTILNDDAAVSLSIADAAVTEGNAGTTDAGFTVTLSPPAAQTVSVDFASADGSATAPADYTASSGTLSFAAGQTSASILVPVVGDLLDEPDETFLVNLSNAQNAGIGDGQGVGTINDDDPAPALSVADASVREGAQGSTTPAGFAVSLSAPSGQAVGVDFATADGSAAAGTDYQAASGSLSFAPGATAASLGVSVNGDDLHEPDEAFQVNLSAPVNATLADGQATGAILDDDPRHELTHGQDVLADLRAQPGPTADADLYSVSQQPWSSYEAVVDGASGDLGAAGPALERLASDGVTVLQNSLPLGGGASRSLRWLNASASSVLGESLRVRGTTCTTTCGPEDVYRIRLYETTAAVPRFNNSASQTTILTLQNRSPEPVSGTLLFWDGAGALLHSQGLFLAPRGAYVLNTSSLPALVGQSGSITIPNDGVYGALDGKAVSVEPTTGFAFDSALVLRPR